MTEYLVILNSCYFLNIGKTYFFQTKYFAKNDCPKVCNTVQLLLLSDSTIVYFPLTKIGQNISYHREEFLEASAKDKFLGNQFGQNLYES
jgi:hypothetical protein